MEKKAAKALCQFVFEAKDAFEHILNSVVLPYEDFSTEKQLYSNNMFTQKYADFEAELQNNVRIYKDNRIIASYLRSIFNVENPWEGMSEAINYRILEIDIENKFLFEFKKNIEDNFSNFDWLAGNSTDLNSPLQNYINSFLEKVKPEPMIILEEPEPVYDMRFCFDALFEECSELKTPTEKIQLITNRLFDFRYWQLKYDMYDPYVSVDGEEQSNYKFTRSVYPLFEKLCNNEIARLHKLIEIEKLAVTMNTVEQNPITIDKTSPYKWNSTATDFLELFAALYHSKKLDRVDGKDFTRKEFLDYIQDIFNVNIKDAEGKLTRATDRKNNRTPFIDSLRTAFETYADGKEEKQRKRR